MVDFRPFRGIRYDPAIVGSMADLICPPYDVISPKQEQALLARNPSNMVRMELAELPGAPSSGRYEDAASAFISFQQSGALRRDAQPTYYVLRQRIEAPGGITERIGILGALRLENFGANVLPHEETRKGPKEDRLALMEATGANFSAPMMLYRDPTRNVASVISVVVAGRPNVDFTVDGEEFALWALNDPAQAATVRGALATQPVYVADGHHRYETAIVYRDRKGNGGTDAACGFVMTCLIDFDDPGLRIQPYYRILHGLDSNQFGQIKARLDTLFKSSPVSVPAEPGQLAAVVAAASRDRMAMVTVEGGQTPLLLTPEGNAVPSPDATASAQDQALAVEAVVLQEMVFRAVLGDSFPDYVIYVHDGADALRVVESGQGQMAFLIKGVAADAFEAVVGAGIRLPAKSTYFHPKLPSGLVISSLEGDL